MSFDITFHPIAACEITYFLFEALDNPSLIESRIKELSQDPDSIKALGTFYQSLLNKIDNRKNHIQGNELAYSCATISTFLHPYWYAGGNSLSDLIGLGVITNTFTSFGPYALGKIAKRIRHNQLLINENWSASGFAMPETATHIYKDVLANIKQTKDRLNQSKRDYINNHMRLMGRIKKLFGFSIIEPIFPDTNMLETLAYLSNEQDPHNDFLWALEKLEAYCSEKNIGFIEAAEIVVPATGDFFGNPENFYAQFMENR